MIVYEDASWSTNSMFPDTDFITWEENRKYWVVPDGSELAMKIQTLMAFDMVFDDNGNLVDVTEKPIPVISQYFGELESLKSQATELDMACIRPLRAIVNGTATDEDREYVAENEAKVIAIRKQIIEINRKIESENSNE